ncbi:hypothetical protein NpNSSI1_00011613 [Neofusicoccum parvum]|nr:hypothetical protein NpNSSI1_00011613 [Neofusicoccum parvum]
MASRSFNNMPSGASRSSSRSSRSSRRYSPTRDAEAAADLSWARTIRSYVPISITTNLARLDPRNRQQHARGTVIIPIVDDDERDSRPRWLRSLPAIPSLSSLARTVAAAALANTTTTGRHRRRRSYATVLEPFHPVDDPCSDDDDGDAASTGTSVPFLDADASLAARPPSSASVDADPDAYFLVHDAGDVDADETYDPRRWAALQRQQRRRPQHPLPGERLWDGAMAVRGVALEAARVGAQVGAVLVSAGTPELVGDLAREVRMRGVRRRVGLEVMREQWLVQTGEGVVEDGQQWVDEDDEDDESDEEDVEEDDVEEESVEDENELEDDEDEYEDEEIVTEGLTGPWVEQTGIGGGSPHEDEVPRPAKDDEGDEDNDSSIDGDEAFFDTLEGSAPSTSHSRSTSTQAASRSGQPTPSSRGAPSSTLPAATLQLTTADHQSLVDASLAAGFDILDEEDTRRPMWDLDDIAPYHRRPLHAYRRSQHTQPHQRSQDLPRSNVGRDNTRDNGRGDGVPTSSTSGSRR